MAASVVQDIHLVLVCPAARTAIHDAHPPAVWRAQELRALVDAAVSGELKGQVGCADADRLARTFRRGYHFDNVNFLTRFVGVGAKWPARVHKEHGALEKDDGAIDGPLIFW